MPKHPTLEEFLARAKQPAYSPAIKPSKTVAIEAPAARAAEPPPPAPLAQGMVSGADMARARTMMRKGDSPDLIAYALKLDLFQVRRLQISIGLGAITKEPDGHPPPPSAWQYSYASGLTPGVESEARIESTPFAQARRRERML